MTNNQFFDMAMMNIFIPFVLAYEYAVANM